MSGSDREANGDPYFWPTPRELVYRFRQLGRLVWEVRHTDCGPIRSVFFLPKTPRVEWVTDGGQRHRLELRTMGYCRYVYDGPKDGRHLTAWLLDRLWREAVRSMNFNELLPMLREFGSPPPLRQRAPSVTPESFPPNPVGR